MEVVCLESVWMLQCWLWSVYCCLPVCNAEGRIRHLEYTRLKLKGAKVCMIIKTLLYRCCTVAFGVFCGRAACNKQKYCSAYRIWHKWRHKVQWEHTVSSLLYCTLYWPWCSFMTHEIYYCIANWNTDVTLCSLKLFPLVLCQNYTVLWNIFNRSWRSWWDMHLCCA